MRIVLRSEGLWAISVYRFGQYVYQEANPLARFFFKPLHTIANKMIGHIVGIHLSPKTQIGPGFYIGHYGGIWISPLAKLGANCNVAQGITIGVAGMGANKGPELGDRVWVGPNATISGPVKVGNSAVVGANCMVVSNIPDKGVAVGVPAKVISFSGSDNLIGPTEPGPPDSPQQKA
jgi:serine O-acetyltransferase